MKFIQYICVLFTAFLTFYFLICTKNEKLYYPTIKDKKLILGSKLTKIKFDYTKVLKIVSFVLIGIFAVRYMWGNEAIRDTFALENNQIDSKFFSLLDLLLFWFNISLDLTIALYPVFKFRSQENLIRLCGLPVALLTYIFMIPYTKGIIGVGAYEMFDFRIILLTLEIGISLGYTTYIFATNLRKQSLEEVKNVLKMLLLILLATMPVFTIQGIFGNSPTTIRPIEFTSVHRYILYGSILLPLVLYFIFKGKPKDVVYFAMLVISIGTLISFSADARFERFSHISDWPWHLCNTAMYIIPLCLIFKERNFAKKLFYFTYFINVLGAFLAMTFPNYSSANNMFAQRVVLFYVNHYIAFFMPLLLVELDMFERPKLKQFKYSMVAFLVYFVLMLMFNAYFTAIGKDVDFFFLNSDFIVKKLGNWAINTRNFELILPIGNLELKFYPIYQSLFFLTYVVLGFGMWFLYENMYKLTDHISDIKERKKKVDLIKEALKLELGDRDMQQPVRPDGENKLIIENFYKKYPTKDVYAVEDLNLEVNAGDIFGFLGPNGAGKSSTIKCLVGIQGLTKGSMFINGYDIEKQPVEAKKQIGYVPDNYALYERLTGREYINFIADIFKVSKEDRYLIDKYVKKLALEEYIDNPIQTYSHGMKQKIAIIQAICHNPKLWILDEPLTGLDIKSTDSVKKLMVSYAKKGNIVFFSSHIMEVVERLCNRVGVVCKGHLVGVITMEELKEKNMTLEQFYYECTGENLKDDKEDEDDDEEEPILPQGV